MSTRPPAPPTMLADDPGPWSVISSIFALAGGPGRRRAAPPMGLMLSPAPQVGRPLVGLGDGQVAAGGGAVRVIAAAREPALGLWADGGDLVGVSAGVMRRWSLPELDLLREDRPATDPVAQARPQVALGESAVPDGALTSPDGSLAAVLTREPRADVLAIVRVSDGALVRWIRGVRAVAWSDDGAYLALGGQWGVLLAERLSAP